MRATAPLLRLRAQQSPGGYPPRQIRGRHAQRLVLLEFNPGSFHFDIVVGRELLADLIVGK
jgi:hypothetical protein